MKNTTRTIKQTVRKQSIIMTILCVFVLVFISMYLAFINVQKSMEDSANDLAINGSSALNNIQRELGFANPVALELAKGYIKKRFDLRFFFKGEGFDFKKCTVHKTFNEDINRIDLCASSFFHFTLVKRLTTPRGVFFVGFYKETDFDFLKKIYPVFFVLIASFLILAFFSYKKVMQMTVLPLAELTEFMKTSNSHKLTPKSTIKEIQEIYYLIQTTRDSAESAAIANTVRSIVHDVGKPFFMLSKTVKNMETMASDEAKIYIKNTAPKIQAAIFAADGFLNDLLNLSSASNFQKTECDLEEIVMSSTAFFDVEDRITTNFEHSGTIFADQIKLTRSIVNIVGNAWDVVRDKNSEKIWIKTKEDHKNVLIIIGNSGSRLSKAESAMIFEKFYSSGKQNGKGLGLVIAKKYIGAHGGSIAVNSSKNSVEFTIKIPKKLG